MPHGQVEEGPGCLARSRFTLSSPVLIVRPWDLVTGLIKAQRNGAGPATARHEQGRGHRASFRRASPHLAPIPSGPSLALGR